MARALLTLLLIPIVALPHDLCFCHYVKASARILEASCCADECPATPDDDPEDDDADCPCKLREVPASTPAIKSAPAQGSQVLPADADPQPIPSSLNATNSRDYQFMSACSILPLIPCALRI